MAAHHIHSLIQKYDVPCPRYTSYPTVPYWQDNLTTEAWEKSVRETFERTRNQGISLYIHLPYCEKLCTYCGCNKRITTNHTVEKPYIDTVLQEWKLYRELLGSQPKIAEIHLGGGTPTFFSAESLQTLIQGILETSVIGPKVEFSLEVHPNYTKKEQLRALYDLGFRRLSVGIQDFDPNVQYIINRPQTFEQTQRVFDDARTMGYQSINADIIYGLPFQTAESIRLTIEKVRELRPERIAFYSYAHVPWKSPAQRRYTEADLPAADEKRRLYELGREMLLASGYREIGMDHFALPEDELYKAYQTHTLHRNFMGYTTQQTELLIGLGASSISDTWNAFAQNSKEVEAYQEAVWMGRLPVFKGHVLTDEDTAIRQHILNLMCQNSTSWQGKTPAYLQDALVRLKAMEADGIVELDSHQITVTEVGKPFVRNIAMQLDERYWHRQTTEPVFSKSI
jgi:oxygen-independent coproporphyrinogen-3 oxidase